MVYIGKSIDFMGRLKSHLYPSSTKTKIDIALKSDIFNFSFFVIDTYENCEINFFNRFLETQTEHRLITKHKSYNPHGYNTRHYGHL